MSNPFNFFKKVCYINLDDRLDRNNQIKTELNKYNINAERISAIRLSEEESEIEGVEKIDNEEESASEEEESASEEENEGEEND